MNLLLCFQILFSARIFLITGKEFFRSQVFYAQHLHYV
jgi:hypothetical protein